MHTDGDFIVLPHWKTRPLAQWPDIWFSQIILTMNQPLLSLAKHLAEKQQVSKLKSLVWINQVRTHTVQIPRSPKKGDGRSTHSAIPSIQSTRWSIKDDWMSVDWRVKTHIRVLAWDKYFHGFFHVLWLQYVIVSACDPVQKLNIFITRAARLTKAHLCTGHTCIMCVRLCCVNLLCEYK